MSGWHSAQLNSACTDRFSCSRSTNMETSEPSSASLVRSGSSWQRRQSSSGMGSAERIVSGRALKTKLSPNTIRVVVAPALVLMFENQLSMVSCTCRCHFLYRRMRLWKVAEYWIRNRKRKAVFNAYGLMTFMLQVTAEKGVPVQIRGLGSKGHGGEQSGGSPASPGGVRQYLSVCFESSTLVESTDHDPHW